MSLAKKLQTRDQQLLLIADALTATYQYYSATTITIDFVQHSLVATDKNLTMLTSMCVHGAQCAAALFDHVIRSSELLNYSILSLGYYVHVELGHARERLAPARYHHRVLCFETT